MKFINLKTRVEEQQLPSSTVLCIGNFDGVHIGHRQLVASVINQQQNLSKAHPNLLRGAWFFDSNSYKGADEIYSLEEKLNTFTSLGLDYVIIADFNVMKNLSPEEFVYDVLKTKCKCIHAVCGDNFKFGSRASGDSKKLYELMNGNASVIPLFSIYDNSLEDDIIVSSTYIRSLLSNGEIEKANVLLNKNYSICETVIHGKALGRTIGIPTINQNITTKKLLLKSGIYGTICDVNGRKFWGVTNVGVRPTVDDSKIRNIETFIIDYNANCYDENVKIEFIFRIRDEIKFDDVDALKSQINRDIETTKEYFANNWKRWEIW